MSDQAILTSLVDSLNAHEGELSDEVAAVIADVRLQLARSAMKSGALDEVAAHLSSIAAAGLDSTRKQAVAQLWQQAARTRKTSPDAEAALREAARLAPAQMLGSLAQFLQQQHRFDEALSVWREGIAHAPQETAAYVGLARLYERIGQPEAALATYMSLIEAAPTMRNTLTVAAALEDLEPGLPAAMPAQSIRIAIVGNATLDQLRAYVTVACTRAGLRPAMYQSGFDQYNQDILNPASDLYAFQPDVMICAVHASRLFPTLQGDPLKLSAAERCAEIEAGLQSVEQLLQTFTQRSSAMVLLHNMVLPQHPSLGLLDSRDELGQTAAFSEINSRLAQLARERFKSVYIVDEDRVQSRSGKRVATDARTWYSARLPWSDGVLAGLASEYMRYVRAACGLNRKCVVLDLDNTLWGGVIGEDGIAGIQLGSEAPGNAFVGFQKELMTLWRRGIMLALCSKNNPDDAFAAIEQHPDMLLRRSYFAAERVNWNEKAENIREIAAELNIGLNSLVFLDDNPVERAKVRATLPQVLVPEMPADPAEYRGFLLELSVFDTLALTEEDRRRNQLYSDQKSRREAEARLADGGSLDAYLADLEQVVELEPVDELNLPRIAQLTNKTNQFNLTTRRYTEAEIQERVARGWRVYAARVKDRFGDNGLTGVLMIEPQDDHWLIDTFLLSCRVMGRRVETAILAHVGTEALEAGVEGLRGWFLPTEKNAPARDVYAENGFVALEQHPDGRVLWHLDITDRLPIVPQWLGVRIVART